MSEQYKYYAFISYSSKDTIWGKRLQRKLEGYRMPSTLCSEHGWKRKPIRPVFFAPTDIQPGGLSEELQERLKASKNLIVICSPNSAKSSWVGKEIEYFHQLGRTRQIHFFIVDGIPHSGDPDTECFNPIVETLGLPEILGANIHEKIYSLPWLNKERAYVQLITKLLGVEFDSIWQRHKRLKYRNIAFWILGITFVITSLIGTWIATSSVDVKMQLTEQSIHNDNLPPMQNAIVTMRLDNEVKIDTINSFSDMSIFTNIPHSFLNKEVNVTVDCRDFLRIDTTLPLNEDMTLGLKRDVSVYGDIRLRVWSLSKEKYLPDFDIIIDGKHVTSDSDGYVNLQIPLSEQKANYNVSASVPLETTIISMPCGENDVILVR